MKLKSWRNSIRFWWHKSLDVKFIFCKFWDAAFSVDNENDADKNRGKGSTEPGMGCCA